ncbi:MAG: SDR family NAD(P)-dependent oxidoreductase [Alphaproteobacteria bacterium]|nr:SDR family NAD(P)-dependent oxidoreductase [Alphaproteobacteria bacterium]
MTSKDLAVVIGASGGIGSALSDALEKGGRFAQVVRLSRSSTPPIDLIDEDSIAAAARHLDELDGAPRLVIDATGMLHGAGVEPEKSWRSLDPAQMAQSFAVNATGPALLMKHLLPLLKRDHTSVFATLSAKVGSIGDNKIGGWWSYRASKAALNQFVRTAAVELARKNKAAICVALHPGTVDTGLSGKFVKTGLDVRSPEQAALDLLAVIERLGPDDSGGFFDYRGDKLPW